jgi:hypothetical protein
MRTTFKTLPFIFIIPLLLLICPLNSQAEEEEAVQEDILILISDHEVINVSTEDIKERLLKGEPVHFVKKQDKAKRTIEAEWITNALKKKYGVEMVDIKDAIIIGNLEFFIKENLVNIEESGIKVETIEALQNNDVEKVCLVLPFINLESCEIQGSLNLVYGDNDSFIVFKNYVSFEYSTFLKNTNFSGAIFNGGAYFKSATFNDKTAFSTILYDVADFESTTFNGEADFEEATFFCKAYFNHTHFNGKVNFSSAGFNEKVDFQSASFTGETDFRSATFNGLTSFKSAIFDGDANFYSATFNGKADFKFAQFKDKAEFSSSSFNEDSDFSYAGFNGKASFLSTIFDSITTFSLAYFSDYVNFDSAIFNDNVDFYSTTFNDSAEFFSAKFNGEALFESAVFNGWAYFISAIFNGGTNFSATSFEDVTTFQEARFKEEVIFNGANFVMNIDLIRTTYPKLRVSWSQLKGLLDEPLYGSKGGLLSCVSDSSGLLRSLKDAKRMASEKDKLAEEFLVEEENYPTSFQATKLVYWEEVYLRLVKNFEDIGDVESAHACYYHYRYNKPKLIKHRLGEKSEELDELPITLEFPEHLKSRINYENKMLTFKGTMTEDEEYSLLQLSDDKSYKVAIEKLYRKSQHLPEYIVGHGWWEQTKELVEYIIFGLTCGYGVYPLRTLGVVGALILFFTTFYLIGCLLFPDKKYLIFQQEGKSLSDDTRFHYKLYNCFYFSVMTFTTVGYGDLHPKGGFKVAAMIEGFLGWMTMALFLVTLGNVSLR